MHMNKRMITKTVRNISECFGEISPIVLRENGYYLMINFRLLTFFSQKTAKGVNETGATEKQNIKKH